MKKIIWSITAFILIAGITITFFMGLNFGLVYSANKQVDIYIGKQFENDDIKNIVKEVLNIDEIMVQKVEIYEEMVTVTAREITDEQLEEINTKINEKYELENKAEELTVVTNSNIRFTELLKPYLWPVVISIVIMGIYAVIVYKKLGILKVIGKFLCASVIVEAVYMSIFAITRLPINRLTIPIGIAVYVIALFVIFNKFENNNEEQNEKEAKKK